MDAKQYLSQIRKYDFLLQNRKEEIVLLKQRSGVFGNELVGREKVQVSKCIDQMEKCIIDYTEQEEMLREEIFHYWHKRSEIIHTIERLKTVEYDLLYKVYVRGWNLQQVADEYGKSYSWTTSMHARALKNVQMILDERGDGNEYY